jgi:hypothetical protein
MNSITEVSSVIQQPVFALLKYNDKPHRVRVLRLIQRTGFAPANLVQLPNGKEIQVPNSILKFPEHTPKNLVEHPEYVKE